MPDLLLALESSSAKGSVSLWGENLVSEKIFFSGMGSQNGLFSVLPEVLEKAAALENSATAKTLLVGVGPGSYSGIRVALTAAQGLGLSKNWRVVAMPSLEGIIIENTEILRHGLPEKVVFIGDARRGGWFVAKRENGVLFGEIEIMPVTQAQHFVEKLASENWLVCSTESEETLDRANWKTLLGDNLLPPGQIPTASGLIHAWQKLAQQIKSQRISQIPAPIYLREPHITQANPVHPLLRKQPNKG